MPIRITDLYQDLKETTVEYAGQSMQVGFRPSGYTPAVESAFHAAMDREMPSNAVADLLDGLLVSWELLDENEEVIPITHETLVKLGSMFLFAMAEAITREMQEDKESQKKSPGTLPLASKRGSFQSGT